MLPFASSAKDPISTDRHLYEPPYMQQQNINPKQVLTGVFLDLKDYNLISLLLDY